MRIKNKYFMRILTLFLILSFFLTLMPSGVEFSSSNAVLATSAFDVNGDGFAAFSLVNGSIQETIDSIASQSEKNGRISLTNDISENISVPDHCQIILDLNGHTLNTIFSGSNSAGIIVYGTLKIIDSAGGGMICSDGTSDIRAVDIVSGGKFVFSVVQ